MKTSPSKNSNPFPSADAQNFHEALTSMIKAVMGKRTSSKIAEECGVNVSTITRIRKGENKRSISEDLLYKIWQSRDSRCDIPYDDLFTANQAVAENERKNDDERYEQRMRETEFLEGRISNSIQNSGQFVRSLRSELEIIPGMDFYTDLAFEIAFETGERRQVFLYNDLLTKDRIERIEKDMAADPAHSPFAWSVARIARKVLDFQELRFQNEASKNAELIVIYNYEPRFLHDHELLKKLSNTANVTTALIDSSRGRFLEERCLDEREGGLLKDLGIIQKQLS